MEKEFILITTNKPHKFERQSVNDNNQYLDVVLCEDISDGYHTMSELYEHRYALFAALIKVYDNYLTPLGSRVKCWKSKLHDDGTIFDDSFIVGMSIQKFDGTHESITYHLPLSWWGKFNVVELDKAPTWDGHTPKNVIERLLRL